ncbi:MAG: Mu transposase C-terminal domain-containing protein [Syntrophobacteraceae bacterium]
MSKRHTPKDIQVITNEHALVRQASGKTAPRDPFKMRQKDIENGTAKHNVIEEYRKFAASAGRGQVLRTKKKFIKEYNLGVFGPYPALFEKTGKLTYQTLQRWLSKHKTTKNPLALADNRGGHLTVGRKSRNSISPEQGERLIAAYLNPNKPKISECVRIARKRMDYEGIAAPQCDKTFASWIKEWEKSNYARCVFFREGEKALNEKCVPHLERDPARIEVGDILVGDGKDQNFEIINPETGKPKRMKLVLWQDFRSTMPLGWEISPTENTQSIAVAMYRAILCLGKIPKIAYIDNGRAFKSQFFWGVKDLRQEAFVGTFKALGMDAIFAWGYHGESKTVERIFQILDELDRRAFSYIGTSIADKPPRCMRGEKVHRALHAHYTKGKIPTIEEAHHAIATWIDQEYGIRPQRGHLNGRTPLEVFMEGRGPGFSAEQEAELRILMGAHKIRRINRDGIKLPGSDVKYYHPDLYGRQLQSALVRFDWQDRSRIFVYDLDGNPICTAEPRKKVHPAAAYLGTEADKQEVKSQIALRRGLEKQTLGPARAIFEKTILPEIQFQQDQLGLKGQLPVPSEPLKQLLPPAGAYIESQELSQSEEADVDAVLAELEAAHAKLDAAPWEKARSLSDFDRYEALLEMEGDGTSLPSSEKAWMSLFERTDQYKRHKGHFEEYQTKIAYLHGA